MSCAASSFQVSVPGSLTIWLPGCSFGCQMQKIAPCGSAITAIRPASSTSNASMKTVPPAPATAPHVASASATVM